MKTTSWACGMLLVLCATSLADVPQTINHQGVVKVNGQPFNGTGHFKFAILNTAGVNVWTNDNSNLILNGVPNTFEDVAVTDGVYSVILGGTGPGYTMSAISPTVFNEPDRKLRIWFDDGVNGLQQLTPDHALSSSPYSQQSAFDPPIGSIIAWHKSMAGTPSLPDGWVECNGQVLGDTSSPYNSQTIPNLNSTPQAEGGFGRFLRGGSVSGTIQVGSTVLTGPSIACGEFLLPPVSDTAVDAHVHVGSGAIPKAASTGNCGSVDGWDTGIVRPVNMSVVWIMRVK